MLTREQALEQIRRELPSDFEIHENIQLNFEEVNKNMTKLNAYAKDYEPASKTKNIADLKEVSTEVELEDDEFEVKDKKTNEVKVVQQKVIIISGEKYRVPSSVIAQLKIVLEDNPNCKKFKVKKTGTTIDDTRYQVIPLG